jgi:hypothetical protein
MAKVFIQSGPQRVAQSGGAQRVFVTLVSETDGVTLVTTAAAARTAVELLKFGATAWAAPSAGTFTTVGHGVYRVTLDATDKNTFGPMLVRVSASTPTTYETQALVWVGASDEDDSGTVRRIRALHATRT